jgi:hypothetical protein
MAQINTKSGKTAPLLAVSLLAALCAVPAYAQEASPPAMAFGQEMPQQFLVNRLVSPSRATVEQTAREDAEAKLDYSRAPGDQRALTPTPGAGKAAAPGEPGKASPSAEVAGGPPADNGNYYDPYPKQFLLNRFLGGGGN